MGRGLAWVLAIVLVGCSTHEDCPGSCIESEGANFRLSCSPNDLVSVVATGPCTNPEAGVSWYTGTGSQLYVVVPSTAAGTCHIVLTFASGFTYSQDVTFQVVPRDSCGCPPYIAPTSGPYVVNNPRSTCVAPPPSADAGEGG